MNIYVGQLPYSVTEEELREMFLQYGEVSSLNLIMDRYSGQSKGFGFKKVSVLSKCPIIQRLIRPSRVSIKA
jgi:hypothetical protein